MYCGDYDDLLPNSLDSTDLDRLTISDDYSYPQKYKAKTSLVGYCALLLPYTKSDEPFRYEPYWEGPPPQAVEPNRGWTNLNIDAYLGVSSHPVSVLSSPASSSSAFRYVGPLTEDRKKPSECLKHDGSVRVQSNGVCEEESYYWMVSDPP